jgi:hypothetical protein
MTEEQRTTFIFVNVTYWKLTDQQLLNLPTDPLWPNSLSSRYCGYTTNDTAQSNCVSKSAGDETSVVVDGALTSK